MTDPTDKVARYERAAALLVEAEALMRQLDEAVPDAGLHVATAQGAVLTRDVADDDAMRDEALGALEAAGARRDRARALNNRITQLRAEVESLLEP